ncbi:DUF6985 domain-containing protein [Flavobacterium sp. KACC 22763]|uniref:DUF6985 domain-containing protein n=1 Tax=Flavobacterium sp. KACC 22763 TaxID=3025668 RepID=UPI00236691CD|nr:hypothetical protein [Flavobacterium sp. KACC 22763]WDF64338.1 hypothetical protein PQ463_22310 [Flavobacterium sp. KACC 22763]
MGAQETFDEWHRREYPSQYIWENYTYPNFGISDDQLVCRLPIRIFNCDDCQLIIDNEEVSETHKSTIEYILRNQESFIEDIQKGIFDYYIFLWNDYLNEFEDDIKYPNPMNNDAQIIDLMIKPKAIHMAGKIDEGYFGICFNSTFEGDHGLGIEMRNYKVKKVGAEYVGFNLHSVE